MRLIQSVSCQLMGRDGSVCIGTCAVQQTACACCSCCPPACRGCSCKQRTVQALPQDAIIYVCAYKVHIEGSTLATPHTVLGVAAQGYTADSSIDGRVRL